MVIPLNAQFPIDGLGFGWCEGFCCLCYYGRITIKYPTHKASNSFLLSFRTFQGIFLMLSLF